jgi:hypothetical protein
MKNVVGIALILIVLAGCKQETQSGSTVNKNVDNHSVSPYIRISPNTGTGLGIGLELAPNMYLDLGSGNIGIGVGF